MTHDPKWEQHFYFDSYVSFNGLRATQLRCGPETVRYYSDLFIGEARQRLLNTISLFALVCGAGKTMLMVATLLAINEQVRMKVNNAPRVGKVLWLVKEHLLGVMLKEELKTEITKWGLHHRAPEVEIYDDTGDIDRGPQHFDFVISCPNVLWKTSATSGRSEQNVCEILSKWDVIIWDECDFADEQTKRLAGLAPHALKFGLTASPIDADGKLLEHFVIASYATYDKIFGEDHCLKKLLPWDVSLEKGYVREISHQDYDLLQGTTVLRLKGQHKQNQALPGQIAAIRAALIDCSNLEQEMRRDWADNWYSPHIIVKCSSKAECEHLYQHANEEIKLLNLQGDGWSATTIYDGYESKKREEKHLFHKDSNVIHPFMRAAKIPRLRGRCDSRSSRVLFICDMAVRGMNCWPVLYLVDIDRGASVNVQVQFKGRDGRWPLFLKKLHADDMFEKYCTGRYYRPDSGGSSGAMQAAYDFIFNMETRIGEAGLLDWEKVLQGETRDPKDEPRGLSAPFSFGDKIQVDTQLGEILQSGKQPTEADIEMIIDALPGYKDPDGKRLERVREHIANVLDPGPKGQEYRVRMCNPEFKVIRPVHHEEAKPADQYSMAELLAFAEKHPKWAPISAGILEQLATNNVVKMMVAADLRERDLRLYNPVGTVFQLNEADGRPGIITDIRKSFSFELYKRRSLDPNREKVKESISKAIYTAVKMLCGVRDVPNATLNKGPLNRASYHHALMMPNNQYMIKRIAETLLIKWRVMESASAVYADQMEQANAAE